MSLSRIFSLVIISIIVIITIAVAFLYANRNALVKEIIVEAGSYALGTQVFVGDVDVRPFDYAISISDFSVQNPPSFPKEEAIGFKNIFVQLPSQLSFEPFHIQTISISEPRLHLFYETDNNNLETLANHAKSLSNTSSSSDTNYEDYRLKIDSLSINETKTSLTSSLLFGKTLSVTLPSLTVQNIGDENGVLPQELANIILSAISEQALDAIGKEITAISDTVLNTIKDTLKTTQEEGQKIIEETKKIFDDPSQMLNNVLGN